MPIVTVLEKKYGRTSPEIIEKIFHNLIKGFSVRLTFDGTSKSGWIKLKIEGNDETIALNLIEKHFGLAPMSLNLLENFSIFKGKVISSTSEKISIDLGIHSDEVLNAVIKKKTLHTQLVDGREIPLDKLIELFCLYENLPLEIMSIKKTKKKLKTIEAVLSERQISFFKNWINSRFDRLLIFGSSIFEVEKAINQSRIHRDIIRIESLGIFEQVILCKLGTDAVGLIPQLGKFLNLKFFAPFSPKKILKYVDSEVFDY
jgi:hypothetical protein